MPFPGSRVVPDGWGEHHAAVAAGGMTATCAIRDPAAPPVSETFDPDTGQTIIEPAAPVYEGPCRVQALSSRDRPVDAVGEAVTTPPYLVQMAFDAPAVDEGWPVRITACPDDPQLVGRTLTVRSVAFGSQRFTRDLYCVDE